MAIVTKHACDWSRGCTEPGTMPVSIKLSRISYLCREHHDQVCELVGARPAPEQWNSQLKERELGF